MPATARNPHLDNTAARYVAKALTRVHPAQRQELLDAMRGHIEAAEAVLDGISVTPAPDFFEAARDLLGVELAAH